MIHDPVGQRVLSHPSAYLFSVFSIWFFASVSMGAEPKFSRSTALCPLDLTYAEFAAAISRIREYSAAANRNVEQRSARESLSLEGGSTKLEMSSDFSERSLTQGPQLATDVWYRFSQEDAPISEVTLRLGDYSRELTVSGLDRTQVEGLILLASEDFVRFGCSFGGSSKRLLAGLGLVALVAVLASIAISPIPLHSAARLALLLTAAVTYPAVLFFPWDKWLPGTAIRAARVSLLERNAAVIGFVGTLAGLVSISIALSPRLRRMFSRGDGGAEPK
jgi:hypothetical protein